MAEDVIQIKHLEQVQASIMHLAPSICFVEPKPI